MPARCQLHQRRASKGRWTVAARQQVVSVCAGVRLCVMWRSRPLRHPQLTMVRFTAGFSVRVLERYGFIHTRCCMAQSGCVDDDQSVEIRGFHCICIRYCIATALWLAPVSHWAHCKPMPNFGALFFSKSKTSKAKGVNMQTRAMPQQYAQGACMFVSAVR